MQNEKGLKAVSVMASIPQDILEVWESSYGRKTAVDIAAHFMAASPYVTLRTNTLRITRERMIDSLGNIAAASKITPSAIRLSGSFPVEDIYGFNEGLFFVQDEASQLAASFINPQVVPEGGVVVDVCACPGGKSFSAAINLSDKAKIYSFDLHANKLSLIQKGAERLGIKNITVAPATQGQTMRRLSEKQMRSSVMCLARDLELFQKSPTSVTNPFPNPNGFPKSRKPFFCLHRST